MFLTPIEPINYDPTNNRITLQLVDGSGKIIGAQSVAVYDNNLRISSIKGCPEKSSSAIVNSQPGFNFINSIKF